MSWWAVIVSESEALLSFYKATGSNIFIRLTHKGRCLGTPHNEIALLTFVYTPSFFLLTILSFHGPFTC